MLLRPRSAGSLLAFVAVAGAGGAVGAATIEPAYQGSYVAADLGSVPGLPDRYGGLTLKAGDPNTLLIGGLANTSAAAVYSVPLVRDAQNHIIGFGAATFYASAFGSAFGGIDGGLAYGPGGILFFTSFPDNKLGQIKPGASYSGKTIALSGLGYDSSVGAMSFLPDWLPGASSNTVKLVSYTAGTWYTGTLSPNGNGFYSISVADSPIVLGGGPQGVTYIKGGNPLFAQNSVLVSEFANSAIVSYQIDGNGDPIVSTRQLFMSGLTGAFGAMIDPLTGDFLFSTFGESENRIVAVRGFDAPLPAVPTPLAIVGGTFLLGMLASRRPERL